MASVRNKCNQYLTSVEPEMHISIEAKAVKAGP